MINYFPTVLATGNAFCNRKDELERLKYNFEKGIPTLLVSPRRYGKTSLALKALEKSKVPYTHIDLYKALNEKDIGEYILNGIGGLLGQIEKAPAKLMRLATEFFASFQLKLAFSGASLKIELMRKQTNTLDLMLNALERLDNLVLNHCTKKSAILFIDEFQTIGEMTKNTAFEAVIREAMQKAKAIRYVFAGSNRHLIELMFNDKNRPFFNSCDQITLSRITSQHYNKQINKASKARWGDILSEEAIAEIFNITERHPYYINKLCSILMRSKTIPDVDKVVDSWEVYKNENISRVQQEVSLLNLNPRRLLINIARDHEVISPFGNDYSNKCGISPTSIHRAMEFLITNDFVYKCKDDKTYRILDPLIRSVLAE